MCFRLLPDSSLCQNGKQVEIITKMIFELCYIEAIIHKGSKTEKVALGVLPNSFLCQNGKQVEIITKMIFELCYIEATIINITEAARQVE